MNNNDFSRFPLFSSLSPEESSAILNSAIKRTYKAKETIIEQGENSHAVYFILEGMVRVYRLGESGNEVNLSILDKGNILGEMSFIDQGPRSAFVVALNDTTLLEISSDKFREILQKHSQLALHLLIELSKRVRTSDQHVENLLTQNLQTRTLNTLKALSDYFPDNQIALTHEEIASIVGATRARVTEALNELEKHKRIINSPRKIVVLS